MKIVLIGKNGQLGREFQKTLPILGKVIALGRNELDVSNLQAVQTILTDLQPDLIINSSAYTDVDQAETKIDLAMRINADAPAVMADTARKIHAVLIHYSTDYVFDGRNNIPYKETDAVNPLNVYGKSKWLGEQNIQQVNGAYLILRTSWVYSLHGNGFVTKVLNWSRKNTTLKIVRDQISCPTWAHSLAKITTNVIQIHQSALQDAMKKHRGIYHLTGDGYTSRYEWAKAILANDPNQTDQLVQVIEPVLSDEFPVPAIRPLFSALDCTKFSNTFKIPLPAWEDSLQLAMAASKN